MMLGEIQEIKTSNAYDIQDNQIIVSGLNIVTPSQKINLVVFLVKFKTPIMEALLFSSEKSRCENYLLFSQFLEF